MCVILQRSAIHEAAKHHGLPVSVLDTHFDKKAATIARTVVEVDAALIPALGQVGTVLYHSVELHDRRELLEGVKRHASKLNRKYLTAP